MPVTYRNRYGKTYFLHGGKTKTGKDKYYFSLKEQGALADGIPDGYEVYENPHAQVFLRKRLVTLLKEVEIETLDSSIKECASLKPYQYKIDYNKDTMTVYLLDDDFDKVVQTINPHYKYDEKKKIDWAKRYGVYTAMMRFRLVDEKDRVFEAERYCFLGSIDEWISIGAPGKLKPLARKYVRHLGKDSFYQIDL